MENKKYAKATLVENTLSSSFKLQNTTLLTTSIKSFRIAPEDNKKAVEKINCQLWETQQDFLKNAEKTLLPGALENFRKSLQSGYPFNEYQAVLNYTPSYNQNCYLSYFYDDYSYTGGAHGITVRASYTFYLPQGREVNLCSFFGVNEDCRMKILKHILKQAEQNVTENPGIYFEDYQSLIAKNFDKNNFYLTPNGIVIYFQQYEIAPYSTGIVEFLIPNQMLTYPPACN